MTRALAVIVVAVSVGALGCAGGGTPRAATPAPPVVDATPPTAPAASVGGAEKGSSSSPGVRKGARVAGGFMTFLGGAAAAAGVAVTAGAVWVSTHQDPGELDAAPEHPGVWWAAATGAALGSTMLMGGGILLINNNQEPEVAVTAGPGRGALAVRF